MNYLYLFLSLASLVYSSCEKEEYSAENEKDVFTLLPLPYEYKELEPILWSQLVYYHHKKEQSKFLETLNEIVSSDSTYESMTVTDILMEYGLVDNDLALSAGGYYNHALFWWSMMPSTCSKSSPEGDLLAQIENYFGSFDTFKDEFTQRAVSLFGSGWLWLCVTPENDMIINGKSSEYSPLAGKECYPLLGIDLWEHAYYLYYFDDIEDWVERWWSIVDWELIEYWYQEYVSDLKPVPV